jgi:predicted phage replisome organizer
MAKIAVERWWNMAEVTWFKVLTDIFSDDKITILQSMPEGDALLVMWFKVLAQAGKTNDGGYIYLRKNIPYTPSMLATLFNKSQMIVELALKTFVQFEMIDIDDSGYLFVTNWERHQSIDALEKIKEQTKLRVQIHREKKKLELQESNVTVTLPKRSSNATELELDLEIDLELEKDKTSSGGNGNRHSYQNVFGVYQREIGELSNIIAEKLVDLELTYTEEWVKQAIKTAVMQGIKKLAYIEGTLKKWKLLNHNEPWTVERKVGEMNGTDSESVRQGFTNEHDKPPKGQIGWLPSKYNRELPEVSGQ